jgi:hypothetical protein
MLEKDKLIIKPVDKEKKIKPIPLPQPIPKEKCILKPK